MVGSMDMMTTEHRKIVMIMVQLTLFLPSTDNKSSLYALYK